ncbi:hypothetical protein [Algoriphagus chordae]|uniref:Uncharacterized protein n=1 Tax=Algoriphagus chordae TaxID=237019 RepID=A0A2W7RJ14_9BACT|nr:hypothetical protein [Algoriphagus chordae]PZX55547.1 hypothetical protein LV85_00772 [Algoriphagus chordae]
MKPNKNNNSTTEAQIKKSATETAKSIADLGKTELARKKRVDPEIQ